ncbi:Crp/Fnr family transcriptional regulator [Paludisphaera mucosa]|uniref:Crp/Fnr family transcriptional regulator n=1 Tax=Paludisphaera mucosa TaxID=3030827 RepID=A0ABT6FJC6_9BACT|nr:Crp/Fnr family transcriptional regulator [Paludisphaera mucosa]MDG3007655.1 Crp/Fnr family transcriptional regulator [Paludisphaera mucosa]
MPLSTKLRDTGNQLLDRLPHDEFDRLAPNLQTVGLALKQVLYQNDAEITHIHFPTTGLISLMTVLEEDDPVEAATVGKEGFVGLTVPLGVTASPHRAICQMNGESIRLPSRSFLEAMDRGPGLTRLVRRYTASTLRATGQGIACNALHPIEARACRWLLMLHDQAGRDEFPMTHEFLSYMLGVRRQSVTVVAGTLQVAGLIDYHRGFITVRNRTGLEDASCECYATVRDYYQKVMV